MAEPLLTFPQVALDTAVEARAELFREAKDLLGRWEYSRSELDRGRLLQVLDDLHVLVAVEAA